MLTKRIAAIKVMHSAHLHSPQERDRFLQEADFLIILKHPHILLIYDFGIDEDEGLPFLVMEYAPNGSLRDLLDRQTQQPLPLSQSLSIIEQVGEALQFAHQLGIVHRDLKPENILFNAQGKVLQKLSRIAESQQAYEKGNQLENQ